MTSRKLLRRISTKLIEKKHTLGLAESCTGGHIASLVTEVSGASQYFSGGLVAYANHTKQRLLGVSKSTLMTRGAVSKETALQMAKGARKAFCSQWALSVTGIAGPTGGTREKPVGLVYYAVAGPNVVMVKKKIFKGDRNQIQKRAANAALQLLASLLG